jgi:hypothetical protein
VVFVCLIVVEIFAVTKDKNEIELNTILEKGSINGKEESLKTVEKTQEWRTKLTQMEDFEE